MLTAGRPVVVVFCATGIAVSGGPRWVERAMPGLKAFIARRESQRLGKVVEGSKNFTSY